MVYRPCSFTPWYKRGVPFGTGFPSLRLFGFDNQAVITVKQGVTRLVSILIMAQRKIH